MTDWAQEDSYYRRRLSRRRVVRGGALGVAGLAGAALIGCSGDDDDPEGTPTPTASPSATDTPTGTATGTPDPGDSTAGGTLRIGMLGDVVSFDPLQASDTHFDTTWQVLERLTVYNRDLVPEGELAPDWEINDDYTEFVFQLREGVTWHSGRDFTSEDVAYNLERMRDPALGFGASAAMAAWFEEAETPDDHTVILRSDVPRPQIFDFNEYFPIGDRESLEGPDALTTLGATGRFMVDEWRPGDLFALVKNPNHWAADEQRLERQDFSVGLDPQTMVQQFESGALDAILHAPLRDYARYTEDDNYQTLTHGTSGYYYLLGFNCVPGAAGTPEALADKRVRQALNWMIDRERFASVVLHDTVQPYSLPWPVGSPAYEEDKVQHYSFNPEEAQALLSAAGVDSLNIGILINQTLPELRELAQMYEADLATLGITLEIRAEDTAAWAATVNEDPPGYNGVYAANTGRANMHPLSMFVLSSFVWGQDGVNNTGYYTDEWKEAVDTLLVTPDPEEQRELLSRVNDIILEDSWVALIAPRPPRLAMQTYVQGVDHYGVREAFRYTHAWLDR